VAGPTFADLLRESGVLSAEQLARVLQLHAQTATPIWQLVLDEGLAEEGALFDAVAKVAKVPRLNLRLVRVDRGAARKIEAGWAETHALVPLWMDPQRGVMAVAMLDPTDYAALDRLGHQTGLEVTREVATPAELASLAAHQFHRADLNRSPQPWAREDSHFDADDLVEDEKASGSFDGWEVPADLMPSPAEAAAELEAAGMRRATEPGLEGFWLGPARGDEPGGPGGVFDSVTAPAPEATLAPPPERFPAWPPLTSPPKGLSIPTHFKPAPRPRADLSQDLLDGLTAPPPAAPPPAPSPAPSAPPRAAPKTARGAPGAAPSARSAPPSSAAQAALRSTGAAPPAPARPAAPVPASPTPSPARPAAAAPSPAPVYPAEPSPPGLSAIPFVPERLGLRRGEAPLDAEALAAPPRLTGGLAPAAVARLSLASIPHPDDDAPLDLGLDDDPPAAPPPAPPPPRAPPPYRPFTPAPADTPAPDLVPVGAVLSPAITGVDEEQEALRRLWPIFESNQEVARALKAVFELCLARGIITREEYLQRLARAPD
jgi:hypothetical protein